MEATAPTFFVAAGAELTLTDLPSHRERSGRPARSGSPAARRARSHVASAVGSSGDLGWQSMAGGDGEKNWQL